MPFSSSLGHFFRLRRFLNPFGREVKLTIPLSFILQLNNLNSLPPLPPNKKKASRTIHSPPPHSVSASDLRKPRSGPAISMSNLRGTLGLSHTTVEGLCEENHDKQISSPVSLVVGH